MKPDAYMPFFGNDFFLAVRGKPDCVSVGYMRALWYYWAQNACVGLVNDESSLRAICEIYSDGDWLRVMPIVFGEFFKLDTSNLWQQKRSRIEWAKSEQRYQARVSGAIKTHQKLGRGRYAQQHAQHG